MNKFKEYLEAASKKTKFIRIDNILIESKINKIKNKEPILNLLKAIKKEFNNINVVYIGDELNGIREINIVCYAGSSISSFITKFIKSSKFLDNLRSEKDSIEHNYFVEFNEDGFKNKSKEKKVKPDYFETYYKIEHWMPEDKNIQNKFQALLKLRNKNKLINFIHDEAYEGALENYLPDEGNLEGLVDYILKKKK